MDVLLMPWFAFPDWIVKLLILAVAAMALVTVRAYGNMSKARMTAVREGRVTAEDYRIAGSSEPDDLAIHTRIIANLFETPVVFYALVAVSIAAKSASWFTVLLSFLFVALRWQHMSEMVGEHDVMKRRKIFINSMRVLMLLILEVTLSALLFGRA